MELLLGIDIGTSSVKVLLMNTEGEIIACKQRKYGTDIPQLGYAEQNPLTWWKKTCLCINECRLY